MSWSIRLTQIAGIPVKLHITFFLILFLGAWQWSGRSEDPMSGAIFGFTLMAAIFLCVVLHELGHSLMARLFGIETREILLMPVGGLAQLEKEPEKPRHELLIAVAGPLVNLLIAGLLLVVGFLPQINLLGALQNGQGLTAALTTEPSLNSLLLWLLSANISLVLFNLIPAFPLDGGRVLRSMLAMVLDHTRATRIAAGIGQLVAVALGIYGLFSGNLLLALVAVFIFMGAMQEAVTSHSKTVLTTRRLDEAYNRHAIILQNGERLSNVVNYLLTSYQSDYAVVFGQRLLGIVTRDDVIRALATHSQDVYVSEIMNRDVMKLDADLNLDEAREQLHKQGVRVAAVYKEQEFLGLISLDDLQEALSVLMFNQRHMQQRVAAR